MFFVKDLDEKEGSIIEFGGGKSLDVAFATLEKVYPKKGWAANNECDMFYIVESGEANIYFNNEENKPFSIKKGSVVYIPKLTSYRVEILNENPLKLWVPCSPKWTKEQYKIE